MGRVLLAPGRATGVKTGPFQLPAMVDYPVCSPEVAEGMNEVNT